MPLCRWFALLIAFLCLNIQNLSAATLYVSKLGDNSDGSNWTKAFNNIQSALDAIPDDKGGHRIIVRPDTYMEAMLSPAHKGAEGAYNELIGDFDGALGSGTTGYVVIDAGDPKKGFKSYDWWGNIRSNQEAWSPEHKDPTFSAIIWDRWRLSGLYATGGDGGLFWDLTNQTKPFTIVVEDCVGIGRAFGGGVASCLSRYDEPITFRRCHLWALDWWGDTAAAYVRVENATMPEQADVIFEDCTMASPQCALKAGNFTFDTSMRIKLNRCRLVALNFSQPHGTPIDGAIQSVVDGKFLHVDLEDTTVMGYKVFGVRVNKETENEITYTTTGDVQAYVQFTQDVPEGFYRLQQWPVAAFHTILPPQIPPHGVEFQSTEIVAKDLCEITPVVWKGRLCHMEAIRPGSGGEKKDYYLRIVDAESGEELSRFAVGYGLACAYVEDDVFYAFASRWEDNNWNDVTMFKSSDLNDWESKVVIEQENEHLFNSSVCKGPEGYAMAYESNDPNWPAFTTKFAVSKDLESWEKLTEAGFGTNRYTACPCIRYVDGYYYVLYLERRPPRHFFETYITRSEDLKTWEVSSANPVLTPNEIDDGINTSDVDLIEWEGDTLVYYTVGDQLSWMNVKRGVYDGSEEDFFKSWYKQPGVPDPGAFHQPKPKPKTSWFNDAKFGIFIHWGTYAVYGKNDKGSYVSWAMENEGIPFPEYEKLADQFTPEQFDADEWMKIFKGAGARYVTFTSKHHEGFCMFDSALTDYDSVDRAAKKDFVKELIDAARKSDMKISFYYSTLDWAQPDFKSDLPKYVDEYLFGQVRELCTNYGPIDGIWFDGEWDHPAETWRADDLVGMIHELQPNALVNDRIGKGERGKTALADFYTREQPVEILKKTETEARKPWEACLTIGESWGYRRDDTKLKSTEELIRFLVDVASRGGNLLLNVGPTPEGEIPAPLVERILGIGKWLEKNGDSIYGTEGSPFSSLPFGKCTVKGNTLYAHLESHPGKPLELPGLKNSIKRVSFLETGQPLVFDNESKTIELPEELLDPVVTVVGVELEGPVRVESFD